MLQYTVQDQRIQYEFDHVTQDASAPPARPGTPQIVDLDADTATLAWLRSGPMVNYTDFPLEKGADCLSSTFEGYQIQFREIGEPYWQLANTRPSLEAQYSVRNLNQFGHYEFRIVAKNIYGFSQPSNSSAAVKLRPKLHHVSSVYSYDKNAAHAPGRPRVVECDGANVVLSWDPPVSYEASGNLVGYHVEYRVVGALDWITATNHLVRKTSCTVPSLRPNGLYEFRIFAKNSDGVSTASPTSAEFRIKSYSAPGYNISQQSPMCSFDNFSCPDVFAPGRPEVIDYDSTSVTIQWPVAVSLTTVDQVANFPVGYIVEYRECGQSAWQIANEFQSIKENRFTVRGLNANSIYESRVFARTVDGSLSPASEPSIPCKLAIKSRSLSQAALPIQPGQPEIMQICDDCVTIRWTPVSPGFRGAPCPAAHGYQVEFRDLKPAGQKLPQWLPVNPFLIQTTKMTIGDLSSGHEYDFRVIAKNDAGFSIPSESSRPIVIGMNAVSSPSTKTLSVSTLKDNLSLMNKDGVFNAGYRDPTLAEVLEYLECTNNVLRLNATGYLQHLTFNDDVTKKKVRDLGGIPRLLQILRVEMPDIQKNACGCLKNLSFGVDENKKAILNSGGITILANLLAKTCDLQVMDEIVGILSNLSSHEDLKLPILQNNVETLTKKIIVPNSITTSSDSNSGPPQQPPVDAVKSKPSLYKGATSVLRNVSSSGDLARKFLRENDRLIESLIAFLRSSCKRSEFDSKSVENVTCILRNLSYRLQETEEKNGLSNGHDKQSNFERSKSAPSGSPKLKLRTSTKQKRKGNEVHNGHIVNGTNSNPYPAPISMLWSQDLVRDYLCLLEHSSNPETLEASAGAIQNLAACHWQPSIDLRMLVRKEKGLPILVQLLSIENDKVVCAIATTLRNLSLDQRNLELIGKYAMDELIKKLPSLASKTTMTTTTTAISEDTVAAILSVIYVTVVKSMEFAKSILEKGGLQKLIDLSNDGQYSARVIKYASQILFCLWQHRELHDLYKKLGFKEENFANRATRNGKIETLGRPVSNQGQENKHHQSYTSLVRPDWSGKERNFAEFSPHTDSKGNLAVNRTLDNHNSIKNEPNGKPSRDSINGGSDANSSRSSASANEKSDQQKRQTAMYNEVTYAQIHKNTANGTSKNKICVAPAAISGAPAGDSWV